LGWSLGLLSQSRQQFNKACEGATAFEDGYCNGYAVGVLDLLIDSGIICLKNNIKQGQINAVVKKYIASHPEKWHLPATGLVPLAVWDASLGSVDISWHQQ